MAASECAPAPAARAAELESPNENARSAANNTVTFMIELLTENLRSAAGRHGVRYGPHDRLSPFCCKAISPRHPRFAIHCSDLGKSVESNSIAPILGGYGREILGPPGRCSREIVILITRRAERREPAETLVPPDGRRRKARHGLERRESSDSLRTATRRWCPRPNLLWFGPFYLCRHLRT